MSDSDRENIIFLRHADPQDMELLYRWVNDPETRRNSFTQHEISREEHEEWFAGMMRDPNRIQYILMDGDVSVGQIRIDIMDEVAQISYSIAPNERGKGFGQRIIGLAKNEIKKEYPFVRTLEAAVKPQNAASISCFESNGFIESNRIYVASIVDITSGGGGASRLSDRSSADTYCQVLAA